MKKSAIIFISTFLLSSTVYAAKPNCTNLKGEWANELGSTLNITSIDSSGKLSGTYTSPSGTAGAAAPMIGWTNTLPPKGNNVTVVSFSVNWGKYGSVTSWSGTCSTANNKSTISTIWNLVRSNSSYSWDHILTNTDTFNPK